MKNILCLVILSLGLCFIVEGQATVTFEKLLHDFGKVKEADGPVSYDFQFKNTGTTPLIIQDVKTTCGCTTPEWTKQPVRPGATGFIKVYYDVKGRPGVIDKTISVYSNAKSSPVALRINGEVIPVDRNPAEAYRYTAGSVRLDEMHVSFSRVYSYEKPSLIVTAYNPGPDPVKLSFMNLPSYIKAEVEPSSIRKGEKASVRITYDAAKKKDWGFVSDRISMILNDDKSKDYKLTVTALIEEDFSRWTASQLQNAPVLVLDKNMIEMGTMRKNETKDYKIKLKNTGKSKLLLRKVDSNSSQIKITAPGELGAGASADITVKYSAENQTGEQSKVITIITNDPKNPNVSIRLTAEII